MPAAEKAPSPVTEALKAIPWLSAVPAGTLAELAAHAVIHRIPAGSRLFEQAETPAFAQLLIAGSVELVATRGAVEAQVELVRPFDLILPAAVLSRQPYLVGARVREAATLVMVGAEAFRRAITADHALCLAVLACQAAHFRRRLRRAKSIRLRSAEERLGRYLLGLLEEARAPEARLPHEKRAIALELGMTRETLSRALPAMARRGVTVVGDVIRLSDPSAAAEAFPFDPLIDGDEPIRPLPLATATLPGTPQ